MVDEFVNPKYKDAAKCEFKKPTRRVHDAGLPQTIEAGSVAGQGRLHDVVFAVAFSPAKNDLEAARSASKQGEPPGAAGAANMKCMRRTRLGWVWPRRACGQEDATVRVDGSLRRAAYCIIAVLALTQADVESKVSANSLKLAGRRATLVLEGPHIRVESLSLNGGLTIVNARDDATLVVRDADVANAGVAFLDIAGRDLPSSKPFEKIRGYKAVDEQWLRVEVPGPGHWVLTGAGTLEKVGTRRSSRLGAS